MSLKKYTEQARQSEFLKNIGKIMSGTGLAHLIGIAILPVLTRLFTPDEFGVYATYLSVFVICYSAAALRYEAAILLPKLESSANNVTVLALLVTMTSVCLLFLVLFFFGDTIAEILNITSIGAFILLVPLSVGAFSVFQIMSMSLNRAKHYSIMAAGRVTIAGGSAGGQTWLGWSQFVSAGLIVGKVFGDLVGATLMLWRRSKLSSSILSGVTPRRMMAMAKRYRNFPLYNTPHALTTSVSNNFPVLLFNSYFSEVVAGFYSIALKACYAPVQVIAQASYQVFGQRVSEKFGKKDRIMPFIKSTILLQGGLAFFPFVLLFIISPWLFSWALGPEWSESGTYVRILTPYFFLVFIVTPLNFIPLLLNRQRKAFAIDVVYLFLRLSSLLTGIYFGSVYLALILYAASGITVSIYQIVWIWMIASRAEKRMFN